MYAFVVLSIVDVLPCMCTTQAAQELGLLVKNADVRASFEDTFPVWAKAIVSYCKKTQIKCSAIHSETEGYNDEMESGKNNFLFNTGCQTTLLYFECPCNTVVTCIFTLTCDASWPFRSLCFNSTALPCFAILTRKK